MSLVLGILGFHLSNRDHAHMLHVVRRVLPARFFWADHWSYRKLATTQWWRTALSNKKIFARVIEHEGMVGGCSKNGPNQSDLATRVVERERKAEPCLLLQNSINGSFCIARKFGY